MRQLTEKETQTLFGKLANYTGSSLKNLIMPLGDGPDADRFVFRLHKDRVYYVRLSIANIATSIARDKFISMGVCLGWFLPLPNDTTHQSPFFTIAPLVLQSPGPYCPLDGALT